MPQNWLYTRHGLYGLGLGHVTYAICIYGIGCIHAVYYTYSVYHSLSQFLNYSVFCLNQLIPGCCFIVNTKYRDIFTEEESEIIINRRSNICVDECLIYKYDSMSFTDISSISPIPAAAPSNLHNLTVLHYTSESGIVNFSVSWLNSKFPYGNARFNLLIATSNGTRILSNHTIFYRRNGKEVPVRLFVHVYVCV